MEYNKTEIDIVIVPEGEGKNKIYSISSIQFPNVVTQGNTIEQAKTRLREALELYFEDQQEVELAQVTRPKLQDVSVHINA